jgi:hypothetical protein
VERYESQSNKYISIISWLGFVGHWINEPPRKFKVRLFGGQVETSGGNPLKSETTKWGVNHLSGGELRTI